MMPVNAIHNLCLESKSPFKVSKFRLRHVRNLGETKRISSASKRLGFVSSERDFAGSVAVQPCKLKFRFCQTAGEEDSSGNWNERRVVNRAEHQLHLYRAQEVAGTF